MRTLVRKILTERMEYDIFLKYIQEIIVVLIDNFINFLHYFNI